ncbi:DUF4124 domain-containing protein [Xenophilus sp. AP218F]|nr:DUF4124 domain-containing protein [Chromobacterium sp. ASV5]OWY37795.1 DUF4124 domain-containing protein [Xenophilus sp. AP218F]
MKSFTVWTFLLGLLLPGLAAAEVYTWKDAGGKTVYSDQPPPNVNARRLDVRAPQAAAGDASAPQARNKAAERKASSGPEADNARIAEANAKIKAQNCLRARDNLKTLQLNGRIRLAGSNALATDAQRAGLIRQAEADVKIWCGK